MRFIAVLFTLMLVGSPRIAAADDSTTQAKKLFLSGRQHFDLGEYADALKDFKEGYRLNDDPVYLYNIAQCERLLGHDNEALRAYQVYLQRSPDAPNRDEAERKIDALREKVAAQKDAARKPPNPVASPPANASQPSPELTAHATQASEHKPVYKKWWFWTTLVVVAAGAGVGLGLGLSHGSSGTTYPAVQF